MWEQLIFYVFIADTAQHFFNFKLQAMPLIHME